MAYTGHPQGGGHKQAAAIGRPPPEVGVAESRVPGTPARKKQGKDKNGIHTASFAVDMPLHVLNHNLGTTGDPIEVVGGVGRTVARLASTTLVCFQS